MNAETRAPNRSAYRPIANLFAIILFAGFTALHPTGPHLLALAIFMTYVAASHFTPRYATARRDSRSKLRKRR